MPRVKTEWSVEGPTVDDRGNPTRGIIASGSTTSDVAEKCRAELAKQFDSPDYTITVTVTPDTRSYVRHVDRQS
jgi:hypothetical protein